MLALHLATLSLAVSDPGSPAPNVPVLASASPIALATAQATAPTPAPTPPADTAPPPPAETETPPASVEPAYDPDHPLANAPGSAVTAETSDSPYDPDHPLALAPGSANEPQWPEEPEKPVSEDPLEGFNRFNYRISQPIDRFILRPLALLYKTIIPKPIRDGVHNALENLFVPTILVNDILQLRPHRAWQTIKRFGLNSTLGIGGLFDMAKRPPFNTPAHPNGFGDTLGYYGAPPGPYLYLPILGPGTLRDLFGAAGDTFTEPLLLDHVTNRTTTTVGNGARRRTIALLSDEFKLSTFGLVAMTVDGLDARARNDAELEAIRKQSIDPYAALRSSFLQDRAGEIARLRAKEGEAPELPGMEDLLKDPGEGSATKPADQTKP